jgi:hypothetical protein
LFLPGNDFVRSRLPFDIALGLATVPLITALLCPYIVAQGLVHAGATALAVGGLALGMAWVNATPALRRATLWFTIASGTIWWVGWNAIQYVAVLRSGCIAYSGQQLEMDGDWHLVRESLQKPWGYNEFPWMQLALICLLAFCATVLVGLDRQAGPATVQTKRKAVAITARATTQTGTSTLP